MKATLQSAHLPDVSNFLVDGSVPSEVYNRAEQDLHGKFVESYLSGQSENPVRLVRLTLITLVDMIIYVVCPNFQIFPDSFMYSND